MIRGFRQIAFLTAISRIFGMLRDMVYSHFFGAAGFFDAWIIAFRIPNLSRRLFGEGAASASFIPVYSEVLHNDSEQAKVLLNTVVTIMFMMLAGIVLIGQIGIWIYLYFCAGKNETELIMSLSLIMLPYMLFICMVAILAGILNVHKHFAMPAVSPVILNIFIIGTVLVTGWLLKIDNVTQLSAVSIAVLAAGLVQLLIQIPPLKRAGISISSAWQVHTESFRKVLFLMGPMILGLTVTQINTLGDDLIAWWFSGSPEKGEFFELFGRQITYPMWRGSVSHLYYAQRLYQLPLGVLGISLATAIFPVMSADAARKDFDALTKTIARGIKAAVFVAIPATAGIFLVARPLISAIFEHGKFTSEDTRLVVWTLVAYSSGLCGYFAQQILTRAFYSMQDSVTPVKSALVAVCANIFLNLTLIWFLGRAGLAASTAICAYLQVLILVLSLRKKFGGSILKGLNTIILKSLVGTLFMGIICIGIIVLMRRLPKGLAFDILQLAVIVPVAIAVYVIVAKLLRNEMLSLFSSRLKR